MTKLARSDHMRLVVHNPALAVLNITPIKLMITHVPIT
jgi:hypothetical protein